MRARHLIPAVLLATAAVGAALAQDEGNAPPTIQIESWEVTRAPLEDSVIQSFTLTSNQVTSFLHEERDCISVTVLVLDPDWQLPGGEDQEENREEVFLRAQAFSYPIRFEDGTIGSEDAFDCGVFPRLRATDLDPDLLGSPVAPAMTDIPARFQSGVLCLTSALAEWIGATADEGFAPVEDAGAPNGLSVRVTFTFRVPEFIGENQYKLRGLIDHDVAYLFQFAVANEKDPDPENVFFFCTAVDVEVIQSPALAPSNARPFADAGSDRTVAAGRTIVLDASRTFDSFNVGFNPFNPDVFLKDSLQFSWEWISGPAVAQPVQESPFDPTAKVTLTVPDPEEPYVFQVSVRDFVNPIVSTDTVNITVLDPSELLPNRSPRAAITGPTQVTVGDIVELSGLESFDADNDTLSYRWAQVNELGLPIASEEVLDAFQPLSGLIQPVVTWQANKAGVYYVRLSVDDGEAKSTIITAVNVIPSVDTEAAAVVADSSSRSSDTAEDTGDSGTSAPVSGLCGAGIVQLAAVPLVLAAWRLRRR